MNPHTAQHAKDVRYIGRDALAALLGYSSAPAPVSILLIDVRRHDERALYGSIRGSVHVPGGRSHAPATQPVRQYTLDITIFAH